VNMVVVPSAGPARSLSQRWRKALPDDAWAGLFIAPVRR
jgi:hypothetical protein